MDKFLFGVFEMSPFWTVAVVAIWLIATTICIGREHAGIATLWFVVFVVLAHLGGVFNAIHSLLHNPEYWVLGAVLYFSGGIAWSMGKFKAFVRRIRKNYDDQILPTLRGEFLNSKGIAGTEIPENQRDNWCKFRDVHDYYKSAVEEMRFKNNKQRIARWAIWWPFSMVYTACSDWIAGFFRYLIEDVLKGVYSRIADQEIAKMSRS